MDRRSARFDGGGLPPPPAGHCVVSVVYSMCTGGDTVIDLHHALGPEAHEGCVDDAWWAVRSQGVPPRYVRLTQGVRSLRRLIFHYGIMDGDACVNSSRGTLEYAPTSAAVAIKRGSGEFPFNNPRAAAAVGVMQRTVDSGICWFGSVCFALFYNTALRDIVVSRLDEALRPHAMACLTCKDASERLRKGLWERYAFGDDYVHSLEHPEDDGQNGMSQILILLAQLRVPVRRFFVSHSGSTPLHDTVRDMRGGEHRFVEKAGDQEPHLICVRFRRGAHATNPRHRPARRIRWGGRTYSLLSLLIGSEHCGHQIAGATPDFTRENWSTACVDAARYGILPFHWSTTRQKGGGYRGGQAHEFWWRMWGVMVPVTFFSGGQCNLSPHNPGTPDGAQGRTNVDFLYLSTPVHPL